MDRGFCHKDMPDNGIIHDIEFYHMLQSKNEFYVLYEFIENRNFFIFMKHYLQVQLDKISMKLYQLQFVNILD